MTGHIYAAVYLVSFMVFAVSSAEVFLIDTNSKKANLHRLALSVDKKSLVLNPVSLEDPTKVESEKLYNLYNRPDNVQQKPFLHRVFGNMFGNANLKTYGAKKYRRPRYDIKQLEGLEPIIKYLLSHKSPNSIHTFQDLTRKEKPFAEDYIDFGDINRAQSAPDFSQDYIDFRLLRKHPKFKRIRRALNNVKQALRSYSENDEEEDEEEDDDGKSKRFEVVKNKRKKVIKSDSEASDDNDFKEKKKNNKKSRPATLESDEEFSDLSDTDSKPKAKAKQVKKKKKESDEVNNDETEKVQLYLQGNKLTMYPPMEADSVEGSDEDTRRHIHRRMRMPYFLPKRYHWTDKEIPNLGYFFFNGPKGVSQESD